MIVSVHDIQGRTIVAVCDENLVGKVLEEDGRRIDLGSGFFKGQVMNDQETGDMIRNADGVNLVGENSVALGVREEVINESNIMLINGVPYAQGVLLKD